MRTSPISKARPLQYSQFCPYHIISTNRSLSRWRKGATEKKQKRGRGKQVSLFPRCGESDLTTRLNRLNCSVLVFFAGLCLVPGAWWCGAVCSVRGIRGEGKASRLCHYLHRITWLCGAAPVVILRRIKVIEGHHNRAQ